jgi:hypothetical protein
MGTVLLAIVGDVAELATEGFQLCFGVVFLKFIYASDLGNATIIDNESKFDVAILTLSTSAALVLEFSACLPSWSDRAIDCDLEGDGMVQK